MWRPFDEGDRRFRIYKIYYKFDYQTRSRLLKIRKKKRSLYVDIDWYYDVNLDRFYETSIIFLMEKIMVNYIILSETFSLCNYIPKFYRLYSYWGRPIWAARPRDHVYPTTN